MLKSKLIIVFTILGVILLAGCSKHTRLNADKLFISLHVVGPQLKSTLKYLPPIGKDLPEDAISDTSDSLWLKRVNISRSTYIPRLILSVNKDGKALGYVGYIRNGTEKKTGYFEFSLSDSMISYLNYNIEKMNNSNLDTLYYETIPMIYDGPEYFISTNNGNIEKQTFILNKHKAPRFVTGFVDSLYGYFQKVRLSDSCSTQFRRDTIIVKKSEMYRDYRLQGLK
ncbi:MAG: hypothetical protein ACM3RX_05970 [Methanococcaceae archaeon]